MIYSQVSGVWLPIGSTEALRHIADIGGMDSTTVSYAAAVSPHLPTLKRDAIHVRLSHNVTLTVGQVRFAVVECTMRAAGRFLLPFRIARMDGPYNPKP